MARYEKWLGAGIGWIAAGPLGGLLGFAAGKTLEPDTHQYQNTANTSAFETNLIVLAAAIIMADGDAGNEELDFAREFFKTHFNPEHIDEKMAILNHCLRKTYDMRKACDDLRNSSQPSTRYQVVTFLYELALSDGTLSQPESTLLFIIAGWLNVNDVDFRKIKASFENYEQQNLYALLGVSPNASFEDIKAAYRRAVLEYHPDRNAGLNATEQKAKAERFLRVQEAYNKIRSDRGFEA